MRSVFRPGTGSGVSASCRHRFMPCLVLGCLTLALVIPTRSDEAAPYPRITEEAFKARLPFFDYDKSIPLEGRIVQQWDQAEAVRVKIVFRGAQGFLVPGLLEFPKSVPKPCPLVLLLHGWSGSKDDWYKDGNYINGGELRTALRDAGYATLALDAATHGERSHEIDYQHVNPFEDPKAPMRRNYFTFAEISIQTVKDYRRALDFLAERGEVDTNRIGLVGYSMGGMDSFYLLSVEPRLKVAVACVPPLLSIGYGPAAPIDYSWGIGRTPFLMLMGRQDGKDDYVAKVEASYAKYLEGPNTKLVWYDRGHKLGAVYIPDALAWIQRHLPREGAPPRPADETTALPALKPGAAVDYAPLAFQPETWKAKGQSTMLLPWVGTNVVFLTTPGDYEGRLMARWVQRLDQGWALYADLTGARPAPGKQIEGRAPIAAVPDFDYTCGAGCGYLGSTGIELAMFYRWNYPALQRQPEAMPHYVFYEMGRNFYTFGDRHSCFATGFAVFMRYVCMDTLQCADDDLPTRRTIDQAEALVAKGDLPFLKTFTNADGLDEKQPRLKDAAGQWINPSDQPVTYASAMLRLWREHGGNPWLARFFRALAQCPSAPSQTRDGARQQCWHWYLAASVAARRDLAPVFAGQWRLPLAEATLRALAALDWTTPGLTLKEVTAQVQPLWR